MFEFMTSMQKNLKIIDIKNNAYWLLEDPLQFPESCISHHDCLYSPVKTEGNNNSVGNKLYIIREQNIEFI